MPDFLAVATERQNDMQRERTGNLRPKFPAAMLFRDVTASRPFRPRNGEACTHVFEVGNGVPPNSRPGT